MVTAYMVSKPNCPYCVKAEALLNKLGIPFTKDVIGETITKEQLLEKAPNAKTVPQIWLNDELIGGYTELEKRVSKNDLTGI